MNWELEIEKKLYILEIYIYYWIIIWDCNRCITSDRVSKHPLFTFDEFYNESINAEAGPEPLWRYYLRRKNL